MPDLPPELARLRGSIDNIDAALIYLLAERFKCTQQVGRLKAEVGLPPSDPDREAEQIARLRALAEQAILRGTGARALRAILEEVLQSVMFDVPSRDDVARVVISREVVMENVNPTLVPRTSPVRRRTPREKSA